MTKTQVLSALQSLHAEIESIEKLFVDGRVSNADVAQEKQQLKVLKARLEAEYKRMATIKGEESLSPEEANFYKPAVDQVWGNISGVHWNSPPSQKLFDQLVDASGYFRYWISELERVD